MTADLIASLTFKDGFTATFDGFLRKSSELEDNLDGLGSKFDALEDETSGASSALSSFFSERFKDTQLSDIVTDLRHKFLELTIAAGEFFLNYAKGGVALNRETETLTVTFTKLLGSVGAANGLIAELKKEAADVGVPFGELAAASQSLVVQTGGVNDEFRSLLKSAELLAAVNPAEGISGAAFSISEFVSSGGTDLTSLNERFGITKSLIRGFVSESSGDLAGLSEALKNSLGDIGFDEGLLEAQKNTIAGLEKEIGAFGTEFQAVFGEPIAEEWKDSLQDVAKFIRENREEILELANSAGDTIAIMIGYTQVAAGYAANVYELVQSITGIGDAGEVFTGIADRINTINRGFQLSISLSAGLSNALVDGVDTGVQVAQERLGAFFGAFQAGSEALQNFENPFTAFEDSWAESSSRFEADVADIGGNIRESFGENFRESFQLMNDGISTSKEVWSEQEAAIDAAANAVENLQEATGSAQDALIETAGEYDDALAEVGEKFVEKQDKLWFDHNQRVARLQEDLTATIAEAAEEATDARLKANEKLESGLADIERKLASDKTEINRKFNENVAKLNADRTSAQRDAATELAEIERDLGDTLAELQADLKDDLAKANRDRAKVNRDTDQKLATDAAKLANTLADLEQDTADKRADIISKAEQARVKRGEDSAAKLLKLEENYQNERKAIEDRFSDEFAEADPFARKLLKFNKDEELRLLEEGKAEKEAKLKEDNDAELALVDDRVKRELEILDREATQKAERLTRDAELRRQALEEDRAERLEALKQREADLKESYERERAAAQENAERARAEREREREEEVAQFAAREDELEARLEREITKKDEAAEKAAEKLQQRNDAELAQIDEREAQKVAKAEEALEKERRNLEDRLEALDYWASQENDKLAAHYAEVEAEQQAHLDKLVEQEKAAREELDALQQGGNPQALPQNINPGNFHLNPGAAGGGNKTTNNTIIVNNNNPGQGYAGSQQTARSVQDALRGFA